MYLSYVRILNFRNLRNVEAQFQPGLNFIYGANAQGKTNLLEALYMLVTGKSFRTRSERELIPWFCEDYQATVIRAHITTRTGTDHYILSFNRAEKHILVNGEPLTRLSELLGRVNAVLFTPADLQLVQGPPSQRRRFLDVCLSQTSSLYLHALQRYDLAHRQRNALLKLHRNRPNLREELRPYHEQLASAGSILVQARKKAISELSQFAREFYHRIARRDEAFEMRFLPSCSLDTISDTAVYDSLFSTLESTVEEDSVRGSTSIGPHRDDFQILLGAHDARDFASQGQQRTCVLALKFAELRYLEKERDESPIFFLDDLLSELDEERRDGLFQALPPHVQTFVTATDREFLSRWQHQAGVYRMDDGNLSPEPTS